MTEKIQSLIERVDNLKGALEVLQKLDKTELQLVKNEVMEAQIMMMGITTDRWQNFLRKRL